MFKDQRKIEAGEKKKKTSTFLSYLRVALGRWLQVSGQRWDAD